MLKRSFAEFHAQKAQPGTLIALEKGYAALKNLQRQRFPEAMFGTTKEDIVEYHKVTQVIETLTKDVQVLSTFSQYSVFLVKLKLKSYQSLTLLIGLRIKMFLLT